MVHSIVALEDEKYLEAVKPEAVYFPVKDGQRTIFGVMNFPSGGFLNSGLSLPKS